MGAAEKISYEKVTEKLDELPTLPSIVHELSRIIGDPMSSTTDIERVMEKDQSLTTKVLKLANSAYYAIPGGVKTLSRAVAYLGFDTVNQLVLSSAIFSALKVKGNVDFDFNRFWQHSIGVAMAAETVAKHARYRAPSDLFTCGLIHDIGKVAMAVVDADTLKVIVDGAAQKNLSFDEAEDDLGVLKHTTLGQLLAQKWTLPLQIQCSIKYHHHKETASRGGITPEMSQIVDFVMLANLLIHALKFGNSGYNKIIGAPKILFERLKINVNELPVLTRNIQKALESADGFLQIIKE